MSTLAAHFRDKTPSADIGMARVRCYWDATGVPKRLSEGDFIVISPSMKALGRKKDLWYESPALVAEVTGIVEIDAGEEATWNADMRYPCRIFFKEPKLVRVRQLPPASLELYEAWNAPGSFRYAEI